MNDEEKRPRWLVHSFIATQFALPAFAQLARLLDPGADSPFGWMMFS